MDNNLKNELIAFKCTKSFKQQLENQAKRENRSLSNYIQNILKKKLLES